MNIFVYEMSKINRNVQRMWDKWIRWPVILRKKITTKLNNSTDKRVNTVTTKLKREINQRVDNLLDYLYDEAKCLQH